MPLFRHWTTLSADNQRSAYRQVGKGLIRIADPVLLLSVRELTVTRREPSSGGPNAEFTVSAAIEILQLGISDTGGPDLTYGA